MIIIAKTIIISYLKQNYDFCNYTLIGSNLCKRNEAGGFRSAGTNMENKRYKKSSNLKFDKTPSMCII